MRPFVVFAAPRSRSFWLANLLDRPEARCGHDTLVMCDRVVDFFDLFVKGMAGTVETGAWRAPHEMKRLPGASFVVLTRDWGEIERSLAKFNLVDPELEQKLKALEEIVSWPGVMTIDFSEMGDFSRVADVYEFCTGQMLDPARFRELSSKNLQINMAERIGVLHIRARQIETFKKEIEDRKSRLVIGEESWITIQQEMYELGAAHFDEVNQGMLDHRPYKPDMNVLGRMAASGVLKLFSARIWGELAGYLSWQLEMDVESEGLMVARQGAWFVASKFSNQGIGWKLFNGSIPELKRLGVKLLEPHCRTQGRGHGLEKFFTRLGAQPTQRDWSLWIGD